MLGESVVGPNVFSRSTCNITPWLRK